MEQDIFKRSSSHLASSSAHGGDSLQLDSKYTIADLICEDANGPLYRGKSIEDNRNVAIRLFTKDSIPLPNPLKHEKICVAQIVGVDEVGVSKNGVAYSVMDLPRGICLHSLLQKKVTLPGRTAVQIALHVSLAVRFLHMCGIVHGHVNTQNIFINRTNQDTIDVQLLHHGLHGQPSNINLPDNLSPELCRRNASLTEADDLWAIGVLLHQMLFGETPFGAETLHATFHQIQHAPLVLPQKLDSELRLIAELLKKILSKSPSARLDGRRLNLALKSLLAEQRIVPDSILPSAQNNAETTVWITSSAPANAQNPPPFVNKKHATRPKPFGLNHVSSASLRATPSTTRSRARVGGGNTDTRSFSERETMPSIPPPLASPNSNFGTMHLGNRDNPSTAISFSEAVTQLHSHNDCAETRRSIDTRILAKQEQSKAKRAKVFSRAIKLLTQKKNNNDADLVSTTVTGK